MLLLLSAASIGTAFYIYREPYPQPLRYHSFADQRTMIGVPNALNVLSNLPFLIVGVWGLFFMAGEGSRRAFLEPAERWPYWPISGVWC